MPLHVQPSQSTQSTCSVFDGSLLAANQTLTLATAMTASQMRIAETIDAFYGDAGAKDGVSRSYKQAVEDLDTETIKALDGPYRYVSFAHHIKLRQRSDLY